MKRFISCLLVAVMLALLVGQAQVGAIKAEGVNQERPKLTIWLLSFLPKGDLFHRSVAYQFGVENNIDIEVIELAEETLIKKVQAGTETGDLPDLVMGLEFMAPSLLKANRLLEVSDVLADMNKQGGGLMDAIIPAMTYNGKQWAIPHQVWADAIYVRKDLLDAKGLKAPETYEEAAKVAKAVTDPTIPVYGYGMHLGACADATAEIHTIIWSFGGTVWGEDGKTVLLKSPETKAAMQYIKDLWDAGVVPPDAVNWDCYANNLCYLQGTCAMIQNAGSVLNEMKQTNQELLAKTVIVPDLKGPKAQLNYTNYEPWFASASTKNPDLVKAYLKFLYQPDRQLEFTKLMDGAWFPVYKDHQKDPLYEDPYLQPFLLDSSRSRTAGWPGGNSAWVQEGSAQYVLKNMVSRIIIDGVDIDTALDEAVKKLEEIRDSFK